MRGQENKSNYQVWMAGYYTVIHFPEQDITILWDKKTMMHVKVGPQWKVSQDKNLRFYVDHNVVSVISS